MQAMIRRIRLSQSQPTTNFPWRAAYVADPELYPRLFELVGLCLSYVYKAHTWNPTLNFTTVDRKITSQTPWEPPHGVRIVVPLRARDGAGGLEPFVSPRVSRDERSAETQKKTLKASHVAQLAQAIDARSVLLHYGPHPDDAASLCGVCPELEMHLIGVCTPGLAHCARLIPASALMREARERARG